MHMWSRIVLLRGFPMTLPLGLAFVMSLGLLLPAYGQHGKLVGEVTDATTGEALIGVNVFFEGTTQGTTTDLDGEYVMIGLRPGTYTLMASYIGYQTQRKPGVRISIDLTTSENFTLSEEIFEGAEVVVTANRSLVQKALTATTAVVDGERIRALAGTVTGDRGEPGTVLDETLTMACGEGAVRLTCGHDGCGHKYSRAAGSPAGLDPHVVERI